MKYMLAFLYLFVGTICTVNADNNKTEDLNKSAEHNTTLSKEKKESNRTQTSSALTEKQIREQMERENKYAKEQKFYQGKEYDLKAVEVNPDSLDHIPVIEPDYDFDITDVYRDDI